MKPRVILVHGFNVSDGGANTVGKLALFFEKEGFEVVHFNYGWTFLFRVRFRSNSYAKRLMALVRPGDAVVGHSHGACVAHLSAHMGAPFGPCCYINPALDSDAVLAPQVSALDVWYSPDDGPTAFAKLIPFHPWGDMGARGYHGEYDKRITNHNKDDNLPVRSDEHSDVFQEPALSYFAPLIVAAVKSHVFSKAHIKKHFSPLHR